MPRHDKPRRKLSTHHIVPRSRLPGVRDKSRNNVVEWDEQFHAAWHTLFVNMTLEEIHEFVERVCVPYEKFPIGRLNDLRSEVIREAEFRHRSRRR